MGVEFERPVGVAAHAAELEYLSALHQTSPRGVRMDGSIRPEDVATYLGSRFCVDITPQEVEETIFQTFGSLKVDDDSSEDAASRKIRRPPSSSEVVSPSEEDKLQFKGSRSRKQNRNEEDEFSYYLDLVQIVSMLLIPTLIKAGAHLGPSRTNSPSTNDEEQRINDDHTNDPLTSTGEEKTSSIEENLIQNVLFMMLQDVSASYSLDLMESR